jgi:hypothetical protein
VVNGAIDIGAFQTQPAVPTLNCAVASDLLWPASGHRVNVGLSVTLDPPDAVLHLEVYADDHAVPADAAHIGPGTLRLRAARRDEGSGRVYLVVATASNGAGTVLAVCTVAVPLHGSPRWVAAVQQRAAAAAAYYQQFQAAPAHFHLLGEATFGGPPAPPPAAGAGGGAVSGVALPLGPQGPAPLPPAAGPPATALAGGAAPGAGVRGGWVDWLTPGLLGDAHAEAYRSTVPGQDQSAWGDAAPDLDACITADGRLP